MTLVNSISIPPETASKVIVVCHAAGTMPKYAPFIINNLAFCAGKTVKLADMPRLGISRKVMDKQRFDECTSLYKGGVE